MNENINANPMDQLFALLELPDEQFDAIAGTIEESFDGAFASTKTQSDVLSQLRSAPQINIEKEKAEIEKLIGDMNENPNFSQKKKDIFEKIVRRSVALTEELSLNLRERISVKIKKINDNAVIPTYAHTTDAGADIFAVEDVTIAAGETKIIPTGIQMEIPMGYEVQIRPRSGMSAKTKIRVANAPGTIDSSFRGEVGIILENIGELDYNIKVGDKIAQMMIAETPMMKFEEVSELSSTERGNGGFGSTDSKELI